MTRMDRHTRTGLIRHVTGCGSGRLRPGCRVLELGCGDGDLARQLAEALPDCTIIVLDSDGGLRRRLRRGESHWPPNVELLSCELDGANFLPGSITAAVAVRDHWPDPWPGLRAVAYWLEPGGRLVLMSTPAPWRRWFRIFLSSVWPLAVTHPIPEGLSPESTSSPAFAVFRKSG